MRDFKVLGLALTLALLFGAISSGSASAKTSLCKVAAQNPCMAANKWEAKTEFTAELVGEAIMTIPAELKCTESKFLLKTQSLEGAPLKSDLSQFSFNTCNPCTSVTATGLNYLASLEFTGGGNGNMTINSGGSGKPTLKYANCPLGVACVYTAEAVAAKVVGGQPAVIKIENANFERESGPLANCGASGVFNAEYQITQAKEPGQMAVNNPRVMVTE